MNQSASESSPPSDDETEKQETKSLVRGFWGVRYQVKDVSRSIDFYTQHLVQVGPQKPSGVWSGLIRRS